MTEEMLQLLAAQRREKEDLLLCIDRAWRGCARQARRARRRLRCLEGVLALTTEEIKLHPGDAVPPADQPRPGETPLEAMSRRLAAAQQEIRQYETKLFACERAILALKKENAELTALYTKACELGFAPADKKARGPFWPDGKGPAPAGECPPVEVVLKGEEALEQSAPDLPEESPAWLSSPMELLEPPEPRQLPAASAPAVPETSPAKGPAASRRRSPLGDMTSQVLDQLELLMEKENIPLKPSSYLQGKLG